MFDSFDYYRPESIEEAANLLKQHENAKLILGGTDLVVQMSEHLFAPNVVIDVSGISALQEIIEGDAGIHIGAAVTHAQMADWASGRKEYYCLHEASLSVGTPQVRNLGTVIGNLCNAVPSADLAPPALVLSATVNITSCEGERAVDACDFFVGPKRTVLQPHEFVTGLTLPRPLANTASKYVKYGPRKAADLAIVGVACMLLLRQDETIEDIKVALGAVAPVPMLVGEASALVGKKYSTTLAAECGKIAADAAKPITDFRASAEYRREMVAHFTQEAVTACAGMIREGC